MDSQTFAIRRMTEGDLGLALDWAAAEGWNPGLSDAQCFYAADPNGFFLGEFGGEPVGCVSAVAYEGEFGFLGLYIVRPEYRGRGFGLRLWTAAMDYLGSRNVGLDGVLAQQENYRKSGFAIACRNVRHRGEGGGADPGGLTDLAAVGFDAIGQYDEVVFPASRRNFLSRWIAQPRAAALASVSGRALAGYGVMRPCRTGFKIGPLFADDPDIAEALFLGLAARAPGEPVFLDTPESNPAAVALARRHGMAPAFETARMYTKGAPDLRADRCYGVTTFELG
jgi:ribosomal protein S18 acetylase RimI-like enzyme